MKKTSILILLFFVAPASAQLRTPGQGTPDRLTIDQAVAEALENNLKLIAERANVSVAQAQLTTAQLRPNPVLSVYGDLLPLAGTQFNSSNNAGPPEFGVRTDFVVETAGKRRQRIDVAQSSVSIAQLRVKDAMRSLILDVQSAFVDVLLATDNLTLARQNYDALNNVVQINSTRVRAGDLAEVDLLRSRVAALQFENSVRQAELRLRTAYQRLRLLLGRGVTARPFEAIGELRRDGAPATREILLEQARQMRPDLLVQRQEQARSLADLRLQIAQGKVDFTLGTEFRRQQGVAGTGNSLGFFFSAPLPVMNRNQGGIERARREQEQKGLVLRSLEQSIDTEVDTALEQFQTASALVEAFEKTMLEQARQVRRVSEYSYTRGEATLVEFLDAQRAFNDTMQGYNEARAEFARELYMLDSVSGKSVNP